MSRLLLIVVFSTAPLGCGAGAPKVQYGAPPTPETTTAGKADAGGQPVNRQDAPNASVAPAKRRIIYTASLDVVVEDLDTARAEVEKLLSKLDGYVAKSDVRNDSGLRRTATYTIRVPVDQFRPTMEFLAALGVPNRHSVDSQDVTEEFVDVEARIKTMKAEEEVMNKLLKESGSRDDVLKTREQIRIIRADIERAQARHEYLSRLTSLSTINLVLNEIKDYKPPTAPTYSNQVTRRLEGSWESFLDLAQWLSLFLVGLVPWLPVILPLGFGGWYARRRWSRRPIV